MASRETAAILIGDKQRFAVEVGEYWEGSPTLRLLRLDDGLRQKLGFPCWGPTTDNLVGHLFRVADHLAITLEFWRETHPSPKERGVVFVIVLPEAEFVSVLEQLIYVLRSSSHSA